MFPNPGPRQLRGICVAALAIAGPCAAGRAGVTFHYALDQSGYEVLPNGDAVVRVFLEEVTTGGTPSLLVAENGLFSAAFKIERLAPEPSQPCRIVAPSSITTNTADFAGPGDQVFGPLVAVSSAGENATVLVFAGAPGATGTIVSPGVRRIHIANVTFRAGATVDQATAFRVSDYDMETQDITTWSNSLGLDSAAYGVASATATIVTTLPYPNETCATAMHVSDGAYSCSNGIAGTDGPAEPACMGAADPQINNDRWWLYTAPIPGTVRVFTCGSAYDTRVAVYGAACPSASNTTIACNDNQCGLASSLFFEAAQGGQYLIRVGGAGTSRGSGTLFITGCPADLDDGSATGHRDGGVTIDDLLYYITLFAGGDIAGDLDDGTGTGARDGGVTIEDLLYFLARFAEGC